MEKTKSKLPLIALGCIAVVVLVAAGVYAGTLLSGRGAEPASALAVRNSVEREVVTGARAVLITEENIDEVREEQAAIAERFGHYRVQMTNDWVFETAYSLSHNVNVRNDESNPGTVFFDLILPETGELLYSSPYIPLGASLDSITLDVALSPGEYEAVVVYHLVDEYYVVQTTLSVGVTLRILG